MSRKAVSSGKHRRGRVVSSRRSTRSLPVNFNNLHITQNPFPVTSGTDFTSDFPLNIPSSIEFPDVTQSINPPISTALPNFDSDYQN